MPTATKLTRPVAVLTIRDFDSMSAIQREDVLTWLKEQRAWLKKNHARVSKRFTARRFL